LKADVLNKRIIVRDVIEAGCYGAAMLACSAVEKIPVERLIRQNIVRSEIIIPNSESAGIYDSKFVTYERMYPALKSFWDA
jgi:sugar (pentulose or hexulose) kinase